MVGSSPGGDSMNHSAQLSCEDIAIAFLGPPLKGVGKESYFRCNQHDDHNPSLAVNCRKNVWLCGPCGASGNAWQLAAFLLRLDPSTKKEIRDELRRKGLLPCVAGSRKISALYDYRDKDGVLQFQVVRYYPKGFIQRRPNGAGGWIWNLKGVKLVPYRLHDFIGKSRVFIPEGEKDADALWDWDLPATCNPMGAGKWRKEFSQYFGGKDVVVIPDADEAGRKHAQQVARNLLGVAASVKLVELPIGKDFSEWVEHGGTREKLETILDSIRPLAPDQLKEGSPSTGEDPPTGKGKRVVRDNHDRSSAASVLVKLAKTAHIDLFHTPDLKGYATIRVEDHRETWALKSSTFRRWLSRLYFESEGKVANTQALSDAVNVITAEAQFQGPVESVFLRIAGYESKIYLDLCDKSWRAVEITPEGWSIVDDPPVRFRRPAGMLPLPEPAKDGQWFRVREFLNLENDDDFVLFSSWVIGSLHPNGPYPILDIGGEQGTAKTTLGRIARALIDPFKAGLRTIPRNERDLMIAANNSHLLGFDNISFIPPWLSDAFCRLSTGGGLATRELYTDEEEAIFDAKRPIFVNGIGEIAVKGDLIDRMIILRLSPIPEDKRLDERTFWVRFESAHPVILGGLLNAASVALRKLPLTNIDRKPRMADFAIWATAAEEGFGFPEGKFLTIYRSNRCEANHVALEASPLATELLNLMKSKGNLWEPTTKELLKELNACVDDEVKKQRWWPGSSKALANALDRIAPNLRAAGLDVKRQGREPGTGRRIWRLAKNDSQNSRHSQGQEDWTRAEDSEPSYPPSSSAPPPETLPLTDTRQTMVEGCEGRDFDHGRSEHAGDDIFEIEI